MNEKEPSNAEAIVGVIMWVVVIGGLMWIMASCGGCWNAGTRLFWH